MARHFISSQLTVIWAITLGVAVLMVLVIYIVHRAARDHRDNLEAKAKPPRTENEPAFVAATVQGHATSQSARTAPPLVIGRSASAF